jgi:peptidoglycan/xylan/chitin deacetylase (PgdA/CDA1 family)
MSTAPIYEEKPARISFYLSIKKALYHTCKAIGLFALARRMTKKALRILCYHGLSLEDESLFAPRTFMVPDTFERGMTYLAEHGIPVLELGEALSKLGTGDLPPSSTVITIDDGFYSTCAKAVSILESFSFPATVYITTYYAVKRSPIFRLVVQYMFWKTREQKLEIQDLGIAGDHPVSIASIAQKRDAIFRIISYGENSLDEQGRAKLAHLLGSRLGVDYGPIVESRILSIMNPEEIETTVRRGIDIELHSHHHDLPLDREAALREIEQNRSVLEPLAGKRLVHFCYPSGFYREEQLPWLREAGIESGVTCKRGLNYPGTNRMELRRFLDGEDVSFIEFEAEISGFSEMARRTMITVMRLFKGS